MLEVRELTKTFESPAGPVQVLCGLTLELEEGGGVAVLAPGGSGKSTLLQILGTLDRPTSGTVLLGGEDPFALDDEAQARFRNERVGFVFQDHCLLPQLTVMENVMVPLMIGAEDTMGPERARKLLTEVGLADKVNDRPVQLTAGEKQRAAIARALVRGPRLLLCDEPTGSLDNKTAHEVAELLEKVRQEHKLTLVVATHDPVVAAKLPRRVLLTDGRL
ncbi:ABC transporter ATP-binding protein [uncultured Paludibaculum sp.]|uniref:ABC transporter ATP-binding protein n=1 Tax=uncultured Paludibaculum sp. TaxID=1765020 RepID=UPI002AAB0CD2|nr:ABC transporter ATP-binding protein [uncultured Paludibaculum sp.]